MSSSGEEERSRAPIAMEEGHKVVELPVQNLQMATFGTISEFVAAGKDWTENEESLGQFFAANGIMEEAKKHSILLIVHGPKT